MDTQRRRARKLFFGPHALFPPLVCAQRYYYGVSLDFRVLPRSGRIVLMERTHDGAYTHTVITLREGGGRFAQLSSHGGASAAHFRTPRQLLLLMRQRTLVGLHYWPQEQLHFYLDPARPPLPSAFPPA